MAGNYLLDTSIVIALSQKDEAVQKRLVAAEEVFLPSVALGELYLGAEKSARVEQSRTPIEEFAIGRSVLSCDAETARHYGRIKNDLRLKGRPLPENDIWIAA